ncbi:MAG: hypothetical protein ABI114_08490 [Rhodanobacter sp.]
MSKSSTALVALLTNWKELTKTRPAESDFSSYGYQVSYGSLEELFKRWESTLNILDAKGYWSTSPEVAIADSPLAIQITALTGIVANGRSNGINWMVNSQFFETMNSIQQRISTLATRQASVNREVAKLLTARGAENIDTVISAAESARKVIELSGIATTDAQLIADAKTEIEASNTLSESTNARLEKLAVEATDSANTASAQKGEIEKLLKTVVELKTAADTREDELGKRVAAVDKHLKETDILAKNAYKSVEEALRKVRDQGLAHSFQERSTALEGERRIWTLMFVGSALVLLTIAIVFAVDLTQMTYEALLVNFLRRVGVAAPLIWVGWYSARQVGRIVRVQEDYEYKAASALAFQAYNEEAKLGADPEMGKKLLELAITTFGENPVRLYGTHDSEPVSPLQAAIKELPAEKIAAILATFGEQTLKAKFWPLTK